jgi:hypothetical protein
MRKLPFILMVIACIGWVGVVILKTQTSLETIVCENCTPDSITSLSSLTGKNIFTVGKSTLEDMLVQHDLSLISYKKQLPHGLVIQAAPNPPIYAIKNTKESKTWKVTQAGLKVETTDLGELPIFIMEQELDHHYLTSLIPFFSFIPAHQPIIILTKNWGELTPNQGTLLIFNPSEPSQQKEIITYLLANWPTTLPKDTKEIDVRFRLPVARSVRTKPGDVWALDQPSASSSTEITPPTASSAAAL